MTIAYHFTGATLRDGRPIPPIGETLVHYGPIAICRSGLHASLHPFGALGYAPGPMLHKVRCEDIVTYHPNTLCCRRRTILATVDAEHLLRRFAADQALSVAAIWDMPPVVRGYLVALDPALRASAEDAAWSAATTTSAAELVAAQAGAQTAADAALPAAWSAARAAAQAAAHATWAVAWAAARDASLASADNAEAARDAALAAARADFRRRVDAAFDQ